MINHSHVSSGRAFYGNKELFRLFLYREIDNEPCVITGYSLGREHSVFKVVPLSEIPLAGQSAPSPPRSRRKRSLVIPFPDGAFAVVNVEGLYWTFSEWVPRRQDAAFFAGPVNPSALADSFAIDLRKRGTPCFVEYIPPAKIASA